MKEFSPKSLQLISFFEEILEESATILSSMEIQELTKFFKEALEVPDTEIDNMIDELLRRLI